VENGKRGRVMSIYIMAFNGMMPLGYLLEGALAQRIGVIATIWIGSSICFVSILVFQTRLAGLSRFVPTTEGNQKLVASPS
jgi:hypothetical protein